VVLRHAYDPILPFICFSFCLIEIEEVFGGILEKEQDVSPGIAAIRTLLTVLEHDTCKCCVLLHSLKSVECIFLEIGLVFNHLMISELFSKKFNSSSQLCS
jgi:hypothetical protein